MKIKSLIFPLTIALSFLVNLNFTSAGLSYHDLLYYIYGTITPQATIVIQEFPITNLKTNDPLYPILQKAIQKWTFPKINTIPLEQPAYQEDFATFIQHIFGEKITYEKNKALEFDWLQNQLQNYLPQSSQKEALAEIKSLLEKEFLYPEKLTTPFPTSLKEIPSYLEKLGDPHTQYYTPQETKEFLASLSGEVSGIWAVLSLNKKEQVEVATVLENSPAEKAGMLIGDIILSVDDKTFSEIKDFQLFISKIKGEKDTLVQLKIQRNGTTLEKNIRRWTIQIPLVSWEKQENRCYISYLSFDHASANALKKQLQKFWSCPVLIFNLRGNPGGIVEEVLGMLDNFISENKPLLKLNYKQGSETYHAQKSGFSFSSDHILILIDQHTASAAEIFAGALKYYFPQAVLLIWEKSYGKGSMQAAVQLSDTSLLKFTTALWAIADQETIDKKGLIPDIQLIDNPKTEQDEVLTTLNIKK